MLGFFFPRKCELDSHFPIWKPNFKFQVYPGICVITIVYGQTDGHRRPLISQYLKWTTALFGDNYVRGSWVVGVANYCSNNHIRSVEHKSDLQSQ